MARGKRGTRAPSTEPTRHSKRLASQEQDDVSPLREYVPPTRRRGRPKKTATIVEESEEGAESADTNTSNDVEPTASFESTSSNDAAVETVASVEAQDVALNQDLPESLVVVTNKQIITIDDDNEDEVEPTATTAAQPTIETTIVETNQFITIDDDEDDENVELPSTSQQKTPQSPITSEYENLYTGEHESSFVNAEEKYPSAAEEFVPLENTNPTEVNSASPENVDTAAGSQGEWINPSSSGRGRIDPESMKTMLDVIAESKRKIEVAKVRQHEEWKDDEEGSLASQAELDLWVPPLPQVTCLTAMTNALLAQSEPTRPDTSGIPEDQFEYPRLSREHLEQLEALFLPNPQLYESQIPLLFEPALQAAFELCRQKFGHRWALNPDCRSELGQKLQFALNYITDAYVMGRLAVNTRLQLEDQREVNRDLRIVDKNKSETIRDLERQLAEARARSTMSSSSRAMRSMPSFLAENYKNMPQASPSKRMRGEANDADDDPSTERPSKKHRPNDYSAKNASSPASPTHLLPHNQYSADILVPRERRPGFFDSQRSRDQLYGGRRPHRDQEQERTQALYAASYQFRMENGRHATVDEIAMMSGALPPPTRQRFPDDEVESAPQLSESAGPATPGAAEPVIDHETATRGRFGITNMFGSVGSLLRKFTFTPRAQQQALALPQNASQAPSQPSAASVPQQPEIVGPRSRPGEAPSQASAVHTPPTSHTNSSRRFEEDEDDCEEPETPTPAFYTGITSETFRPQQSGAQSSLKRVMSTAPGTPRRNVPATERLRRAKAARARRDAEEEERERAIEQARAREEEAERERIEHEHRVETTRRLEYAMAHPPPIEMIREILSMRERGLSCGIKRKVRVDDLVKIPRSADSNLNVLSFFEEDSEDGEDYVYLDNHGLLSRVEPDDIVWKDTEYGKHREPDREMQPPTAKKVRFAADLETGPTPSATWKTQQGSPFKGSMNEVERVLTPALKASTGPSLTAGDRHRAQPYMGKLFNDNFEEGDMTDDNVFGTSQSQPQEDVQDFTEKENAALAYGQKYGVWTGPKVVPKPGQFCVPDDSDDETESERDTSMMSTTSDHFVPNDSPPQQQLVDVDDPPASALDSDDVEQTPKKWWELLPKPDPNTSEGRRLIQAKEELARSQVGAPVSIASMTSEEYEAYMKEQNEAMSVPSLSTTPAPAPVDPEALARVRSQAEKYKPKTPSGLRESSRMSSSPLVPGSEDRLATARPATSIAATPSSGPVQAPQPASAAEDPAYKQSVQYAVDLANQIRVEDLPTHGLVWPVKTGRSAYADIIPPEGFTMLDEWMLTEDFKRESKATWASAWNNYQQGKALGATTLAADTAL